MPRAQMITQFLGGDVGPIVTPPLDAYGNPHDPPGPATPTTAATGVGAPAGTGQRPDDDRAGTRHSLLRPPPSAPALPSTTLLTRLTRPALPTPAQRSTASTMASLIRR